MLAEQVCIRRGSSDARIVCLFRSWMCFKTQLPGYKSSFACCDLLWFGGCKNQA